LISDLETSKQGSSKIIIKKDAFDGLKSVITLSMITTGDFFKLPGDDNIVGD